jgi:flagellar basal body-associated protein FliL
MMEDDTSELINNEKRKKRRRIYLGVVAVLVVFVLLGLIFVISPSHRSAETNGGENTDLELISFYSRNIL